MLKTIERQLKVLNDKNAVPFEYTFKEMKDHPQLKGYDLKFEVDYFVVHVWLVFPLDYPFRAPTILFYNLNSGVKHPLIDDTKKVNMCDYCPAMDIRQIIIECYLIFCEILESGMNEDLVELGEVTFPTIEEEIESHEQMKEYKEKFFNNEKQIEEDITDCFIKSFGL